MNRREVNSISMRTALLEVGVNIDDLPQKLARSPVQPPREAPADVERQIIRQILVDAGAPARDLDWLSASAPTIAHARTYRPPASPEGDTLP